MNEKLEKAVGVALIATIVSMYVAVVVYAYREARRPYRIRRLR